MPDYTVKPDIDVLLKSNNNAAARANLGVQAALTSTSPLGLSQGGTGAITASAALAALSGVPTTRTVSVGTGLTGGGDLSANRTISISSISTSQITGLGGAAVLSVGTTAGTVAAGDDSRLSNARTPTSHASTHAAVGSDPITITSAQISGSLTQNTTGTSSNVTGTVAIANGGTGATTRQNAMDALAGATTSGQYLRGNGTDVVMSAIQAADVPTLNQNTTGTAANVTGIVAIANGGTGQTTSTAALNALLPTQTGNNGKVLSTDGANATWTTASGGGTPSGPAGGDLAGTYPNPTLATVAGLTSGQYGSASSVAQVTVNAKGQTTLASNVAIAIGTNQVTGLSATALGAITQLSGDVTTGTGGGSQAATLKTLVGLTSGQYGSATSVAQVTINEKGLTTLATSVPIAITTAQVTGLNAVAVGALPLTGGTVTGATVVQVTDNTNAALRVTQLGTGNAILVEDDINPDSTPFVVNQFGQVLLGKLNTRTFSGITPSFQIEGSSSQGGSSLGACNNTTSVSSAGALYLARSRGTTAGDSTIVQNGDTIGVISFNAADGTQLLTSASIISTVEGTPATGDVPGSLLFYTKPQGGANTKRLAIASDGTSTFSGPAVVQVTDNANPALRVTQLGTGNAIVVEDETNPDSTPLVVNSVGNVFVGNTSAVQLASSIPKLQSHTNTSVTPFDAVSWAAAAANTQIGFGKSRGGSPGTYAIAQNGDGILLDFRFDNGTNITTKSALISAIVDGVPSATSMPGKLTFSTTPSGAIVPVDRMTISSAGKVGIGTAPDTTAALKVDTNGIMFGDGTTQTTAPKGATDVQVFTTSGTWTWTKPAGAIAVEVTLIGGGGGGGSGRKTASGTAGYGGGGGAGGGYSMRVLSAALLGATETVTVGAGGAGGAAQTTASTNGNNGVSGGNSSFGTWVVAAGGNAGSGGTTSSGTAGSIAAQRAMFTGGAGGSGGSGAGTASSNSNFCTGGGGGGGFTTTPASNVGGSGGIPLGTTLTGTAASGSSSGSNPGSDGFSVPVNTPTSGGGAGGGYATTGGNSTNGGAGGIYGGGGGGGGAGLDTAGNSGAGGNGANGIVVVITYF